MRIIFLLALIAISQAARAPLTQTGQLQQVTFASPPVHVLQSGDQMNRFVDVQVQFPRAFVTNPNIILTNFLMDYQASAPVGVKFWVQSQSLTGFTVRFQALTTRQVYGVFLNYLATDDPRILVADVEVSGDALGELSRGGGGQLRNNRVQVNYPNAFPAQVQQVSATVFVTGFRFTAGNFFYVNVAEVTRQSLVVVGTSQGDTVVEYFRVSVVIADANALFSTALQFEAPGGHPWLNRGPGESAVDVSTDVPTNFRQGGTIMFGISGWHGNLDRNQRYFVRSLRLTDNNSRLTAQFGTWWDSIQLRLYAKAFIYTPGDYLIFNPDCAEVFSECNFRGQSVEICTNVQNFAERNFNGPVRSFWVPPGKTLRLYNQQGLRGQTVSYTESQACVQNMSFSLIQVHENQ